MFRKLFLLILFVAFGALMLSVFTAERGGPGWMAFAGGASPSQKPLPKAWANASRAEVRLMGQPEQPPADTQTAPSSACPAEVSVQRGDTLGEIAKRCAVTLADLLAANPSITNPNRIYPGQLLAVRGGNSARGGADPIAVTAQPPAGGYVPGAQVSVVAGGFAPNAQVKIGIGLPGAGFKALGVFTAGSDGHLAVALSIPPTARAGERAFFLLTSTGVPTTQIVSDPFVIGN